jgi:hypothetical protein
MSVTGYYLNKNAIPAAGKTMDVADYYYLNRNAYANNDAVKSYFNKSVGRPVNNNSTVVIGGGKKNSAAAAHHDKKHKNSGNGNGAGVDKRFKSLPASEALPRGEAIGGYIFVCNNDTMEENLKRQLFGMLAASSVFISHSFIHSLELDRLYPTYIFQHRIYTESNQDQLPSFVFYSSNSIQSEY